MQHPFPYIHRDLSWLSFNHRVLQEAKDPTVPLIERIRFLAIYSSNLDEFFRVRVGQLKNLVELGKKEKKELEFSPKERLRQVLKTVNKQQEEFSAIFENDILSELSANRIHLLKPEQLNDIQMNFIEKYFQDNMLPFVQPVLLIGKKVKPFLNNAALYLVLLMKDTERKDSGYDYGIVKIPSDHLPRFLHLPAETISDHDLIMLDDVVRHNMVNLFPGYDILDSYSVKLTRDAELYIDDEFEGDLVQKIKDSLKKRNVGLASRFVYDRAMPEELLLDFLCQSFDLSKYDLLPEGRYHNNFDFFKFPDFNMFHLKNPEMPPLPFNILSDYADIFEAIRAKDHFIHVPYHSYESVIAFFELASRDPHVTHIKIVQYRVARESRIMTALMRAAKEGKQVSVFVEVKARFDEKANIEWGEKLEKAGVHVHYSFPGLKVHSKIALVLRTGRRRYCKILFLFKYRKLSRKYS